MSVQERKLYIEAMEFIQFGLVDIIATDELTGLNNTGFINLTPGAWVATSEYRTTKTPDRLSLAYENVSLRSSIKPEKCHLLEFYCSGIPAR